MYSLNSCFLSSSAWELRTNISVDGAPSFELLTSYLLHTDFFSYSPLFRSSSICISLFSLSLPSSACILIYLCMHVCFVFPRQFYTVHSFSYSFSSLWLSPPVWIPSLLLYQACSPFSFWHCPESFPVFSFLHLSLYFAVYQLHLKITLHCLPFVVTVITLPAVFYLHVPACVHQQNKVTFNWIG